MRRISLALGFGLVLLGLTACGGGGGSSSTAGSGGGNAVTSSTVSLPSSVQVVTPTN